MIFPPLRGFCISLYEFVFKLHFYRLFSRTHRSERQKVIVFVDDRRLPYRFFRGKVRYGVADRLRNILSVYSFCKRHRFDFRLRYTCPFDLTDYLIPNSYDWRIADNEISKSLLTTKLLLLSCEGLMSDGIDAVKHRAKLRKKVTHGSLFTQFHIYGNAYFAKKDFHSLFHDLFRPTEQVRAAVMAHKSAISSAYESVSLRFRALLGDIEEENSFPLPHDGQVKLMKECADKIEELWDSGYFKTRKILITSDSKKFLDYAKFRFDFAYIIPGVRVNAEFARVRDDAAFLNIFVDFMMLTDAERLTLLMTGDMYESGFPHLASLIGNRPFEVIKW